MKPSWVIQTEQFELELNNGLIIMPHSEAPLLFRIIGGDISKLEGHKLCGGLFLNYQNDQTLSGSYFFFGGPHSKDFNVHKIILK
jgi:hypothetical protein